MSTLFVMIMDYILWALHNKVNKIKLGHRKLNMLKLVECVFAYDPMFCAENREILEQNEEYIVEERRTQG